MTSASSAIPPNAVRDFFNRKAGRWLRKYEQSGPLAHRLQIFGEKLGQVLPSPAHVLELGCGTGNLAAYLASRGYAVAACDIAEKMLAEARQAFPSAGIDWRLVADAGALPAADGAFDGLLASSVFEYVDDLPQLFAECHRVLRPGGILLVSVPTPGHWHRRFEWGMAPLATFVRGVPAPWPERLQGYADYLLLSRNRLPVSRWEALAGCAGFALAEVPDLRAGSLTLLTFRRT